MEERNAFRVELGTHPVSAKYFSVAAPLLLLNIGILPAALIPALLAIALAGNLLEELLFRGYLQGELLAQRGLGRMAGRYGRGIDSVAISVVLIIIIIFMRRADAKGRARDP